MFCIPPAAFNAESLQNATK